jgi:trehalose 6-phosphate synthase/phosphatase
MTQVIIVSNRLPISVNKIKGKLKFSTSLGGLATGLSSYVSNKSGNVWIGWPGIASDELTEKDKREIKKHLAHQGYIPVFLSQKQVDDFYNGYSNTILWPYFHGLPVRSIEEKQIDKWWRAYSSVNKQFSEAVLSEAKSDSQIWVHDYQLLVLPAMLRKKLKDSSIGFFLHIPFPEYKQFKRVEQDIQLLDGILGSDLIGFHTPSYVTNFLDSVGNIEGLDADRQEIKLENRIVRVGEFPMGIDYAKYAESSKQKDVQVLFKNYKKQYKGKKVIASVDRLDPSKGLIQRLKAYKQFLEDYPKKHGKVVFVMVAAPSRTDILEYKNLSNKLDKLAQEINDKFGQEDWAPLDYINQPIPFENVTALFKAADVAFITPIKDGMNLAAKEFVASNKDGILILSRTAGAAEELKDAILVDPTDLEDLVLALNKALNMRRRELKRRVNKMRRHLSTHTVQNWAKTFVDSLSQPLPGTPTFTKPLIGPLETKLVKDYKAAKKRLFFLDYDGTLVSFSKNYAEAKPSQDLIDLLTRLGEDRSNEIVLTSGRSAKELDEWFGDLPINLVAEHGAEIKKQNGSWIKAIKDSTAWQKSLIPVIQEYVDLTPGSKLEVKRHSLVWHYRGVSPYIAQKNLVILRRTLGPSLKKKGLNIMQGNKVLEIKQAGLNKGSSAFSWLNSSYDFVLALGDDVTDEDIFSVLPLTSVTIKVGRGLTKAQFRLGSNKDVIKLLKSLN